MGVAVFAFSLIAPTALAQLAPSRGHVVVASTIDLDLALGDVLDAPVSLLSAAAPAAFPLPAPTYEPQPPPSPRPVTPTVVATDPGGSTVTVTASWYGPGFYGNRLPCWQWLKANGLPIQFEADTWGVANKTLPCGTMLRLRHGAREIVVPVVDRGPYVAGREIDLSPRVKAALGCTDLCTVVMQVQ